MNVLSRAEFHLHGVLLIRLYVYVPSLAFVVLLCVQGRLFLSINIMHQSCIYVHITVQLIERAPQSANDLTTYILLWQYISLQLRCCGSLSYCSSKTDGWSSKHLFTTVNYWSPSLKNPIQIVIAVRPSFENERSGKPKLVRSIDDDRDNFWKLQVSLKSQRSMLQDQIIVTRMKGLVNFTTCNWACGVPTNLHCSPGQNHRIHWLHLQALASILTLTMDHKLSKKQQGRRMAKGSIEGINPSTLGMKV